MPPDQLENLVRIGQLKPEPPAEKDISSLIRSGLAQLPPASKDESRDRRGYYLIRGCC